MHLSKLIPARIYIVSHKQKCDGHTTIMMIVIMITVIIILIMKMLIIRIITSLLIIRF